MSCKFDTSDEFVATVFRQELIDEDDLRYTEALRDQMDWCEQRLKLSCGPELYVHGSGYWHDVDNRRVHFEYHYFVNSSVSSCWQTCTSTQRYNVHYPDI